MSSNLLDRGFLWMRSKAFFHRFCWFTRILLAVGFFPTGLVKLMGRRFTNLGTDNPVGYFFEAMYQTGLYWHFLGATQMLAAVLIVMPRTAHLGAAVFLPIMVNIFVITISIPFSGTPVVTGLMLLAVSFLVFWDWDRFRPIFVETPSPTLPDVDLRLDNWERVGFGLFGICLFGFFMGARSMPIPFMGLLPILGTLGGFLALGRYFWNLRTGPA